MKLLDIIVLILIIIGAINWGIIGILQYNPITLFIGENIISKIFYVLIGLSGIYSISFFMKK